MKSNKNLAEKGEDILESVVSSWLRGAFPALPEEGIQVNQGLSLLPVLVDIYVFKTKMFKMFKMFISPDFSNLEKDRPHFVIIILRN